MRAGFRPLAAAASPRDTATAAERRAATAAERRAVDFALSGPRRRHLIVCASVGVVLVVVSAARTLLGDVHISPAEFVRVMQGERIPVVSFLLTEITLPRTVLGVLTGAAFGAAGAVFQTVLRNPLASPDIVGVSMGASTGAVIGIVLLGLRGASVSLLAVIGAITIALLTRWIAGPGGSMRIVLVGVGVAVALNSVIQYLFTRADEWDAQVVLRWLTGSLSAATWPTIGWVAPLVATLLLCTALAARDLPANELGSDTATGLGMASWRPEALLGIAVLLTAVAVAAVGPLAFVAFVSGPLARALNAGRRSLTASALCGAVVVVASDYLGDYLMVDINLPAGVVTGAAGAVFLLWLLSRGRTGRNAP